MESKPSAKDVLLSANVISIDFDGVLVAPLKWSTWFYSRTSLLLPDYGFFNFIEYAFSYLTTSVRRSPPKGCKEALEVLTSKGKTLYLLTSRKGLLENSSQRVLTKFKIASFFANRFFNKEHEVPWKHKSLILSKVSEIQVHVDDSLATIKLLAEALPSKQFVWLSSKQSGALQDVLSKPNVFQLASWSALL